MKRARILLLSLLGCGSVACSALLHEDAPQCASDGDCAALGFHDLVCSSAGLCIKDPEPTGGDSGGPGEAGKSAGGSANPSGGSATAGGGGKPSGGASSGSGGAAMAGTGGAGSAGSSGSGGNAGSATAGGGNGGSGGVAEPQCNPTACGAASGSCQAGVCVIQCKVQDCAPHCPTGMPCRVECADDSCVGAVDCSKASSCDISCGASSCLGGVACAGKSCTVACTGDKSCSNLPIVCRARTCDIGCPGLQTCKELKCLSTPQTCSVECGGIQSCGTSFESTALQNKFDCTAAGSCAIAIDPCCKGGAICTGAYKPMCP